MKTTTFQDILFAACEFATRTRDQIPVQEYVSVQGFIAAEFLTLWNLRAWSDLVPPVANVISGPLQGETSGNQFSKNVGQAGEMGDILGLYAQNPQTHRHARPIGFYEGQDGDGNPIVWVDSGRTNIWVEYQLPYPGTAWPDLTLMNTAAFLPALCPLRFRNVLAHKAAAHLFGSDMGAAFQSGQFKLGEMELAAQILRPDMTPPPWRRTIRLSAPRRGGRHW